MHFVVTARITPFNPGASPPPVNIPTLLTSAMSSPLLSSEKSSLANPHCGSTRSGHRPRPFPAGRNLRRCSTTSPTSSGSCGSPTAPRPIDPGESSGSGASGRYLIDFVYYGACPFRLHGQYLPVPDRAGRLRGRPAARGPGERSLRGLRRDRRLARRVAARRPGAEERWSARARPQLPTGATDRTGRLQRLRLRPDHGRG